MNSALKALLLVPLVLCLGCPHRSPLWSPDGSQLLVLSGPKGEEVEKAASQLWLVNAKARTATRIAAPETDLRILAALQLMGALGLSAVLVFFALDVIQLRGTVPQERLLSFQAGALIAELKHLTSFLALLLIGVGGWKSAEPRAADVEKAEGKPAIVIKSYD